MGRKILITGGKGGVGKSTFVCNLAVSLALLGRKALLVDAGEGVRTLDVMLGVDESTVFDLGDVLSGNCAIDDALIDVESLENRGEIKLFAAPLDFEASKADGVFEEFILQVEDEFDYVLIDCAPVKNFAFCGFLPAVDEVIVVSENDLISTKAAAFVHRKILSYGDKRAKFILNKFDPRAVKGKDFLTIDEIIDETSMQLLGTIPFDGRVSLTDSVTERAKNKKMSDSVSKIVGRLEGKNIPLDPKKG